MKLENEVKDVMDVVKWNSPRSQDLMTKRLIEQNEKSNS